MRENGSKKSDYEIKMLIGKEEKEDQTNNNLNEKKYLIYYHVFKTDRKE